MNEIPMENIFNTICKKCAERDQSCCNFKLFLTKDEIEKIKEFKPNLKYKKDGPGFSLVRNTNKGRHRCQFLTETGCILPKELKALDCEIFPLNIIYKNHQTEFYLSKYCQFYKEIPEQWIEEMKITALEKFNSWSEEEKQHYSKIAENIENTHKEILIRK